MIEYRDARVNGVRLHFALAGQGPPVFLLHGYPETSYAWRHQIPALSRSYTVVAPDLRGYGRSEKPAAGYDKRTMADDVRALAEELGFGRIALVGHDRGARVATRFAKDHRDAIDRLVAIDNIPTRVVFQQTDATLARDYWFFYFQQVADLPEALVSGREELFLRHFFSEWTHDPHALSETDIATYVRAYSQPGALRGAFSDYRAGALDLAQDEADADELIDCPTLTLWGADFDLVGQRFDVLDVWRGVARDVSGLAIDRCKHLPHEERPDVVNAALLSFLQGWEG